MKKLKKNLIYFGLLMVLVCGVIFASSATEVFAYAKGDKVVLNNQTVYSYEGYGGADGTRTGTWYVLDPTPVSGFVKLTNSPTGTACSFWVPESYLNTNEAAWSGPFSHSPAHDPGAANISPLTALSGFDYVEIKTGPGQYRWRANGLDNKNYECVWNNYGRSYEANWKGESALDGSVTLTNSFRWIKANDWQMHQTRVLMYRGAHLSDEIVNAAGGATNIYITYTSLNSTIITYWELDESGTMLYDSGWINGNTGDVYKIKDSRTRRILFYFKNVTDGNLAAASGQTTPINDGEFTYTTVEFWGPTCTNRWH